MIGDDSSSNDEDFKDIITGMGAPVGKGIATAEKVLQKAIIEKDRTFQIDGLDLQDLSFMQQRKWASLEEIYLRKNMVSNIEVLNQFPSLRIIDASNNYIEEVHLHLPNLETLNLKNNYLKQFPQLEHMTKLKNLDLGSNQIESLTKAFPELTPGLTVLDLSSNNLMCSVTKEADQLVQKLAGFHGLVVLNLSDNPIFSEEGLEMLTNQGYDIRQELLNLLKKLDYLNGDDTAVVQQSIYLAQRNAQIRENNEVDTLVAPTVVAKQTVATEEKKPWTKSRKVVPPPDLRVLMANLEAANSHPSFALDHLKDLVDNVNLVIEKVEMVEEHFTVGMEEQEVEEGMETFLQQAQLLVDNNFELQSIMLSILAKLSIINFKQFGLSCFNCLKDLMRSGRDMAAKVQEVVKNEVINKMRQRDPTVIPVSLLQGLEQLVRDTEQSDMLEGMFEMCFPVWLRLYCEKLEHCKSTKQVMPNDEHYDAIVSLIAVSVKDNLQNVDRVLEKQLAPFITKIIQQSSWYHDRYIPCLSLIERLANASTDLSDIFMESLVHQIVLGQIRKSLKIYKKSHSLFDGSSKETIQQQMLKYQTLASEIKTLGGLMNSSAINRQYIITDPVVLDLISIMSHPLTDPILLTAICQFALDLFECPELRFNMEFMEPFYSRIGDLKQCIPYLGLDRFYDLLAMTRRYNQVKTKTVSQTTPDLFMDDDQQKKKPGKDSKEKGKRNMAQEEAVQQEILFKMRHLDDPLVNELFISIIRLIRFFCLEAESNEQNKLFEAISSSLNDNNREAALFNCLNIPDDDVKLAVVECLFVVPLEEYDYQEVEHITKVMAACNNIGAGKTELVLSTIFWICSKFVQSNPDETPSSKVFQTKFGEQVILESLSILERNQLRVTEDEGEDEEKFCLSISILNFFKMASLAPIMQKYLKERNKNFTRLLYLEDQYSSSQTKAVPIDIENTVMGREMNALLDSISAYEGVQPYCDVALRIIMRMADVLMYRHECQAYEMSQHEDVEAELKKFQSRAYRKKKKQEVDFWVDIPSSFFEQLTASQLVELTNQHYNFTQSNGSAILTMFLTSQHPINEELVKELSDECFSQQKQWSNKMSISQEVSAKKAELEQKFKAKYLRDQLSIRKDFLAKAQNEATRQQQLVSDAASSVNFHPKRGQCVETRNYSYKQQLQFEELGGGYSETQLEASGGGNKEEIEQKLLEKQIQEQKQQQEQGRILSMKQKRGDGFLNHKIRVLTISAYLRCLYASIEYAPSMTLKMNAVQSIRDPLMFRDITQLCDTVNWDEGANIGAKYLRIMRQVLRLPADRDSESNSIIELYELVALVIQKALAKIVSKMKRDIQLTDGDQVTIYEISFTFCTLLQQANNFVFSDFDLLKQHRINEYFLMSDKQPQSQQPSLLYTPQKPKGSTKVPANLFKELENGPWKLKCEYEQQQSLKGLTAHTIELPSAVLRSKRTVQNKVVEFLVLKLFNRQSIFSLVDVLFKDMKEDYKLIEATQGCSEGEESSVDESTDSEESEDLTKFGVDVDEYMSIKGVLAIERVKDIVGEIMSSCQKHMKYHILEYIMKSVIFHKKRLRESFMQEILNAADNASYRTALQDYMNTQQITTFKTAGDPSLPLETVSRTERVIEVSEVDLNNAIVDFVVHGKEVEEIQVDFSREEGLVKRIFVLSNQGIQILKNIPSKLLCSKCPPQKFCPRGPKQEFCILFRNIESIITFAQMPQMLVINYKHDLLDGHNQPKASYKYQLTLRFPTFTKAAKVFQQMLSILKAVRHLEEKRQQQAQRLARKNTYMRATPSGKKEKAPEKPLTQADLLVQHEVKKLLKRVNPRIKKAAIYAMQLIHAQLVQTSLVSPAFLKLQSVTGKPKLNRQILQAHRADEEVCSTPRSSATPTPTGLFAFMSTQQNLKEEEENVIPDSVIVGLVGGYLICFKEKWSKWLFIGENEQIKLYNQKHKQGPTPDHEVLSTFGPIDDESARHTQREMERSCRSKETTLFKPVVILHISDIDNISIFKGKDPKVEITCFSNPKATLILQFPGDMERQKFVETIISLHQRKAQDQDLEDEDEVPATRGGPESDDGRLVEESEEEPMDPILYD